MIVFISTRNGMDLSTKQLVDELVKFKRFEAEMDSLEILIEGLRRDVIRATDAITLYSKYEEDYSGDLDYYFDSLRNVSDILSKMDHKLARDKKYIGKRLTRAYDSLTKDQN